MITSRIHRLTRVCLLSAFLALALFSFFVFGAARVHAQTGNSTSSTIVTSRIIYSTQNGFQFSPAALTVKSGTTVKIVNTTTHNEILYNNQGSDFSVPAGKSMKIIVTQSESFTFICRPVSLVITVA